MEQKEEFEIEPQKVDFDEYRYASWNVNATDPGGYFTFYKTAIDAVKENPNGFVCKVSFKKLGQFTIEETLVKIN